MKKKNSPEIQYFTFSDIKEILGKDALTAPSHKIRTAVGIPRKADYI